MKTLRGMAVAAGAAVLAAMAMTGCSVDFNAKTRHETKSYDIPGTFPAFTIHGDGRLEVVGTDRPGIRVVESLRWSNDENKPKTERIVRGQALTLRTKCVRTVIGYNACDAGYRVEVPKATAVTLHSDSGAVRVKGLTGNALRLHSDAGSIRAEGVRTRTLTATSDSGRIVLDGTADNATLRAESGEIRASELRATGMVNAHSDSGRIQLDLTAAPTSVTASADSGEVVLTLPVVNQGYAINLDTESGAERIDPRLVRNSASPHRVNVRTDAGQVVLRSQDEG